MVRMSNLTTCYLRRRDNRGLTIRTVSFTARTYALCHCNRAVLVVLIFLGLAIMVFDSVSQQSHQNPFPCVFILFMIYFTEFGGCRHLFFQLGNELCGQYKSVCGCSNLLNFATTRTFPGVCTRFRRRARSLTL